MRTYLLIAAALVAGAGLSAPAAAAPPRGWAHDSGLIKLAPNGPAQRGDSALDRLMIQDAMARWGIAYDEGKLDVIRSLFTDDALFEVRLGSAPPIVSAKGKETIVSNVTAAMQQQGDQRRHAISNVVIQDLTRDHASVIAYAVVVVPSDPPAVNATVVYSANLLKDAKGTWRFTRLVIGMDAYLGTPPATGNGTADAKH